MKITGILVDVESLHPLVSKKEVEESKLEPLYRILNCGTIDIVTRKICNEYFDIVCDDEGLFKENPVVSAIDKDGNPALVGNLFICRHTNDGHLSSLKDEDCKKIYSSLCLFSTGKRMYFGVTVEY